MTEEEQKTYDHILNLQSPSTRAAMTLSSEDRAKSTALFSGAEAQCKKEDGSVDLGKIRELSKEEFEFYESVRRHAGARFEDARTNYLMANMEKGKVNPNLLTQIETNHVKPTEEARGRAELAFMGKLKSITQRFKEMVGQMFKPQHADVVAEEMRKMNEK